MQCNLASVGMHVHTIPIVEYIIVTDSVLFLNYRTFYAIAGKDEDPIMWLLHHGQEMRRLQG